jgi:hypothetical protein
MDKITRNNYYEYVLKKFPDFQKSEIFQKIVVGDEEIPYVVSNALCNWLINTNKKLFGYKKEINKMYEFINEIYEIGDYSIQEMIAIEFVQPLSHSKKLKKKAIILLNSSLKKI